MVDILIKGGTIVDGSGSERFVSDIVIDKGKIAYVGTKENVNAEKVIDARNKIVCPGFIDIHSHADLSVWKDDNAKILLVLWLFS